MEQENKTVRKGLQVKMFGEFSIRLGDRVLTDDVSRIKKVWILIEYLLVNRKSAVPQDKLIETLWNEEDSDNPVGALKNLVYRARSVLKTLDESIGPELIQYVTSAYAWNDVLRLKLTRSNSKSLGVRRQKKPTKIKKWRNTVRRSTCIAALFFQNRLMPNG